MAQIIFKKASSLKVIPKRTSQAWRNLSGAARFWILCGKRKGCWEWMGARNKNGYGTIHADKKTLLAHRYSYELNYGPIPEGMVVMHDCDNPACTNYSHLILGTDKTNAEDRERKGRGGNRKGEANGRAKLTSDQVQFVLELGPRQNKSATARLLGVRDSAIGHILSGRNWA